MKALTEKNIKIAFLVVLLTNLFCVHDEFTKQAYKFIEAILKEYQYCKKLMKKQFNKNLIMSEEEEPIK